MQSSLIVWSSLNCFHAHQPAATNSMPFQSVYTLHLQHLSNRRHIWIPVKHLWCSFFAEIVDFFRLLAIFAKELHCGSWAELVECLRRGFLSLGLHKGSFDSACILILLIYTKRKAKRWNLWLTPCPHFPSLKLCKCSQISHPSPRIASTPNRTKTNHHWINHPQILHMH